MPLIEREQRPDVGARQVRRTRIALERVGHGRNPLGAGGDQETVLEQFPFRKLQQAQRQRNDRGVQTTGEEIGHQGLTGGLPEIEIDPRRRRLQALEDLAEQVGCQRRHHADGDSQRRVCKPLAHGFEKQGLVEDPQRLLMNVPAHLGQDDPAAVAFNQRAAQGAFQLLDLQR